MKPSRSVTNYKRRGYYLSQINLSPIWLPYYNQFIEAYVKNFFWTQPHFLSEDHVHALFSWAKECEDDGLLKPASIGKGNRKHQNTEIRTDKIYWIDQFSSSKGKLVQDIFSDLQKILRQKFFLPAKRFECHFAKYEPGSFYKVHQDRHFEKPGRLVTCVVYLTGSECGQGGELIVYDEELRKVTIQPEPGRIVVFDSSLEHEVLRTQTNRWSLTGWIRSDLHPGIRL